MHCGKSVQYGDISGPYCPVFSPNTRKYKPEITSYLDNFHTVMEEIECKICQPVLWQSIFWTILRSLFLLLSEDKLFPEQNYCHVSQNIQVGFFKVLLAKVQKSIFRMEYEICWMETSIFCLKGLPLSMCYWNNYFSPLLFIF